MAIDAMHDHPVDRDHAAETLDRPPEMPKGGGWAGALAAGPRASLAVSGLFVIAVFAVLKFAQDLFLPIAVAFVLSLVFSPVVRFLGRFGLPAAAASVLIMIALFATLFTAFYNLSGPVESWVERGPQLGRQIEDKLRELRRPMEAVIAAEKQVREAASGSNGDEDTPDPGEPQTVVVEGPGYLQSFAFSFFSIATTLFVTMILLTFLLASGDLFYAKLVQTFDRMSDKKRALRAAHDIERTVSRYLFTITLINIGLGIAVGTAMMWLGMPTPFLWGAIATFANFIPYIGAIGGLILVTLVALVSFDTLGAALTVSAVYFTLTTLEGQVITPVVVGRRLELNAVAVFIAVAFWAWLWGIAGAIIAVPMLVVVKEICEQTQRWKPISHFLSSE